MTRTEWHVLRDSVEPTNASAVLNVARSLQAEAAARAVPAYLVVGVDQADGRADLEGLLRAEPPGLPWRLIDTAAKTVLGRSLSGPRRADFAAATSIPTHIYLHNQPWLASAFRRRHSSAQIFLYAHNVLLRRAPRPTVRRLVGELDGVICVSQFLADELAQRCGLDPARLHVVHSGVNAAAFDVPGAEGAVAEQTDVAFVGRLVEEKGVHVLVEALARLDERGVRLSARIAGAASFYGPFRPAAYERRLRATAAARGLDVRFDGYLEPKDVPRYLNAARIVVVPSVWPEPLGLVALEALASSAALVCSRAGGLREIADGGALLVEPGDPRELADALETLVTNDGLRRRLAAAGRLRAAERTWARAYERLRLVDLSDLPPQATARAAHISPPDHSEERYP